MHFSHSIYVIFAAIALAAESAEIAADVTSVVAPNSTVEDAAQFDTLEARAWHFPSVFSDARDHLTNGAQRINEAINTFLHDPSQGGAAAVTALIAGLDGQIDASLGTIFSIAHYATFGLSDPVAKFILGPFFQSVTDGIEVLAGNLIGGAVDVVVPGSLYHNVKRLVKQGKAFHMDTSRLAHLTTRLEETLPKVKRGDLVEIEARAWHIPTVFSDARDHLTNAAQRITEVTHGVLTNPSQGGATAVTALITALDGQIDASLGTIFSIAHYATFGLSDPLAKFILGPFFQSVTDGIEVLLGNVVGAAIDVVVPGSLYHNVKRLVKQGKAYRMDTSRLAHLTTRLEETLPKKK